MNFSSETKKQLCAAEIKSGCDLPLLSAVVHTCAVIRRFGSSTELRIISSNPALHELASYLLKKLFSLETVSDGRDTVIRKDAMKALEELRIMTRNENGEVEFVKGVEPTLVKRDKYRRAYLKGAFLGSGSLSEKSWHLEITVQTEEMANDLKRLIEGYKLSAHVFRRKDKYVVYLKKREDICDFMALVGAMKASLELSGRLAENKVKTDTRRSVNLMLSNMDRTIDVGVKQMQAIKRISRTAGLGALGPKLREVAALRADNASLSYDDIAAELGISKGSVKYRFKMIMQFAEQCPRIKDEEE